MFFRHAVLTLNGAVFIYSEGGEAYKRHYKAESGKCGREEDGQRRGVRGIRCMRGERGIRGVRGETGDFSEG